MAFDAKVVDEFFQSAILIDGKGDNQTKNTAVSNALDDCPGLRHELLKLCIFLLSFFGKYIVEGRKVLIKACWNCLRMSDLRTQMLAHLTVAVFVDVYPTPADVIHQVYGALVNAGNIDKNLPQVLKAIDVLVPSIPRRLSAEKYLKLIILTKRVLLSEGAPGCAFIHIARVLTRHPQIFYQHRSHFVAHMLHSLSRMALTKTSDRGNKMLALDVVQMILCWELTQRYEAKKRARKNEKKKKKSAGKTLERENETPDSAFVLNPQMMSAIVHFCMRLALLSSGSSAASSLKSVENRSMRLFRCALKLCDKVHGTDTHMSLRIKFVYLARHLQHYVLRLRSEKKRTQERFR